MTQKPIQPGQLYEVLPDGRWAIYLDATMASSFNVCPLYFYESFVKNLSPKGDRPFVRDLGSWWSAMMEIIYGAMSKGQDISPEELIKIATSEWDILRMDELETLHPKAFKEFGGRFGALQMIAEYVHRQLPIDKSTWRIIAAEASFGRNREVCIGETDRIILYWMGQPDLFVIYGDRIMPVDHKSIGKIDAYTHRKYKPNLQIPGYVIAGRVLLKDLGYNYPCDRAIINCVGRKDELLKDGSDIKRPRFRRYYITYSEAELDLWKSQRLRQAEDIRRCFETGLWEMRENACAFMWGRSCVFQNIHEKDLPVWEHIRKADYITRPAWIPGRKSEEEKNKE